MHQPNAKTRNKETYQSWLVGFTIVFVIFVKCYMMWVNPSVQRAYQKPQKKFEMQPQAVLQYPDLRIRSTDK